MNNTFLQGPSHVERKYVKKQLFISSLLCGAAALFFYFITDFPFDRSIVITSSIASFMYLLVWIFFDALKNFYYQMVLSLSVAACVLLGFVVHVSGGIISPLGFFYFAILMSDAAYGTSSMITIVVAILSYCTVVLGEASGILAVNYVTAQQIYRSHGTVAVFLIGVASLMFITGNIGRIWIAKLRLDVEDENLQKQAILKRLSELDAYAHIGLLAHRIVHDLRGPLASISGYIELERLSPERNAEEAATLADLSETVVKMSDALTNITRFGRATDGKKEMIMMKDFFGSLISMLSFYKDAQKVQFRQNYPDAGDFSMMALRQDLQQAYFNILKNAVEAVKDNTGDKIVEISMRQSGGMLEVNVTSNGQPVPEEILPKLFRKAVTGKADGTGVGLLITHDLLMKNDISIEIRNVEGIGVIVCTKMPLIA